MYYAYNVKTADGDIYRGIVAGDNFVSAMCKVDDYYDSVCATSVWLVCVTVGECYDIDDVNEGLCDDDNEDEEDEEENDYDEIHSDCCDGNTTVKIGIDSHIDMDELKELENFLKSFEEEE